MYYFVVGVLLIQVMLSLSAEPSSFTTEVESHPAPGCIFGSRLHGLGSSWHPDLGHPFGVMYCVTCHCVKAPEASGSRVTTKVTCSDVRKNCPIVTCEGARTPRKECCKVCPEDLETDDEEELPDKISKHIASSPALDSNYYKKISLNDDVELENEKAKYFLALLTSKDGGSFYRVSFHLDRNNLHFTMQYQHFQPSTVELLNQDNSVLFRHSPTSSPKPGHPTLCGIWRNLAKHHVTALERKILRFRAITSVMTSAGEVVKTTSIGVITRHRALQRETFSSLLTHQPQGGSSGAVAMIALGRHHLNRFHFALLFKNESFSSSSLRNISMTIKLKNKRGKVVKSSEKQLLVRNVEFGEVWRFNNALLKELAERQLYFELMIASEKAQPRQYRGEITTRHDCALLQAVLSGSQCMQPAGTGAAGSALFTLHPNNSLSYKISTVGLSSNVKRISVIGEYRRRTRQVADLTKSYKEDKAEGRLDELNGKELHMLLSNRLKVLVKTDHSNSGELAGEVTSSLYEGLDGRYEGLPTSLAGFLMKPPVFTGAAGHAWLGLDDECNLHYEIVLAGLSKTLDKSLSAYLLGLSGTSSNYKQLLKGFRNTEARGVLKKLPGLMFDQLNSGTAFIQVSTKRHPSGEIGGFVFLQNNCSRADEASSDKDIGFHQFRATTKHHTSLNFGHLLRRQHFSSCFFDGNWIADGKEWSPDYDPHCTLCNCKRGSVICNPVSCPLLSCKHPVSVENTCCPVCNDGFGELAEKKKAVSIGSVFVSSPGRLEEIGRNRVYGNQEAIGCYHEGRVHEFGSWWHPTFPQLRMITCVNCTCGYDGEITCDRVVCPPVTCGQPVKLKSGDCCKTCLPVKATQLPVLSKPRDKSIQKDSRNRMCEFGSELRAPGEEWTLRIPNQKQFSCLQCKCPINGNKATCQRNCSSINNNCNKVTRNIKHCCPWQCTG